MVEKITNGDIHNTRDKENTALGNLESLITLKEALVSDIQALLEIQKSVSDTHTYAALLNEEKWQNMLKKYKVFLIEKGKDTVGSLAYEQKNADNVYIADIAIKPAFQRQGIGREVLKNLLQKFKDVKRIDLLTHPENKALKLYESLGFVTESVEENYYGDGEPRLVLALEKK